MYSGHCALVQGDKAFIQTGFSLIHFKTSAKQAGNIRIEWRVNGIPGKTSYA
jgi:hypothetical protein